MNEELTRVELFFLEDTVNYWLRFGQFFYEKNIDRRRSFVWFRAAQTFCYIRWWANAYGTQYWSLVILKSCSIEDIRMQRYPGIYPGAELLTCIKGSTYVKRILNIFDEIEEQSINLGQVSPDYYRYIGHCVSSSKTPHPYNLDQHLAYQKSLGEAQ